ncbi:uncharacterized protein LOC143286363 [Babylonia areolata]|uniref:uncharacterized protein LOC143286363 n=1 Tax=Babylonia areolata TaxID=304850 RepID=UPI003FD4B576
MAIETCTCWMFHGVRYSSSSSPQAIQKELAVDRAQLSATVRKKTSAQDSRPSAQATGSVGIVMLAIVVVLLVTPDVITVVRYVTVQVADLRERRRARRAVEGLGNG